MIQRFWKRSQLINAMKNGLYHLVQWSCEADLYIDILHLVSIRGAKVY